MSHSEGHARHRIRRAAASRDERMGGGRTADYSERSPLQRLLILSGIRRGARPRKR